MTAIVHVQAEDQPVTVHRVETQGGSVTLKPGQHETFTVRPTETISIESSHKEPLSW